MSNIRQRDPVLLGICSQVDLDRSLEKARLDTSEEESRTTKK